MNNEEFKRILINRCFNFARKVIALVDGFPNKRSAWVITDQLIRAATSIGANIIEAQAASSKKDFINFFTYALKSANESKVWLALLRDTDKGDAQETQWLLDELMQIANILAASILTMKGKK